MKLPENYSSWIEFAKKCDEYQKEHPNVDTVKGGYGINAVKAKAFDELMESTNFNFGHVMQFKDVALSRGTYFDEINSITDLLLNFVKC